MRNEVITGHLCRLPPKLFNALSSVSFVVQNYSDLCHQDTMIAETIEACLMEIATGQNFEALRNENVIKPSWLAA